MDEKVVELVCVRHGEADHNVEGMQWTRFTQETVLSCLLQPEGTVHRHTVKKIRTTNIGIS